MAAPVSLAFRISANLDELRRNLEEAKSQLETTKQAMQRMVNSFDGAKVIADANAIVKAVGDIGGVSKLTEAELRRANAAVQEGLEKYRVLGKEAPEALKQTAAQLQAQIPLLDRIKAALGPLGPAFAAAFSAVAALVTVQALKQAAMAALDYAASLQKMQAATDIGVVGLQRLENIAVGSNTTLQALTSSILDMQRRLATGEPSAVSAVRRLNLELEAFTALKGDEQFMAIARALGEMTNEQERNKLAFQLFGRSYKEILSALVADVDGLASSVRVNSAEQVQQLAEVETGWQQLQLNVKRYVLAIVNNIAGAGRETAQWRFEMQLLNGEVAKLPLPRVSAPNLPAIGGPPALDLESDADMRAVYRELEDGLRRSQEALRRTTAEGVKHVEVLQAAALAYKTYVTETRLGLIVIPDLTTRTREFREELSRLESHALGAALGLAQIPDVAPHFTKEIQAARDAGRESISVFTGMKDAFAAIWEGMSGGEGFKGVLSNLGGGIVEGFGHLLSGGITSLANLAISGLASVGKGLLGLFGVNFGPSKEQLAAREQQEQFIALLNQRADAEQRLRIAQQGGDNFASMLVVAGDALRNLGYDGERTRLVIKDLLDTEHPKNFARGLEEVRRALELNDQAQQALNDAIQRYGFTIQELGPALQRQKLSEQAEQLYQDYQILIGAGVDTVAVTNRMSEAVNQYVHLAMQMGIDVPAAMRPMLQAMIDQGLLTDLAGNKITDLEHSGLSFTDALTAGMKSLISSVQDLVDVLRRQLGLAVDETRDKINDIPRTIEVQVGFFHFQRPNPEYEAQFQHMGGLIMHAGGAIEAARQHAKVLQFIPRAHSGLAVDERLIVAQTQEGILSRRDMAALGGVSGFNAFRRALHGGGGTVVDLREVKDELIKLRRTAERRDAELPHRLGVAVRDAVAGVRHGR